ncbi:chromate transporter [Marinithermofilum abyssi]|uniref:Chromate transporter n=1 Tax=Marinithermofilum abyssi TaxID=1571185 RepID=A0A8J2VJV7_9BACL|nr:chromate transporter [Marinithermofilum abyssi]GGE25817.1 chromate transporter [Marinithermofilum abyssi]
MSASHGENAHRRETATKGSLWEVWAVSTRLGLTSFGGPAAHLGYFREEYVERRKWLHEKTYAQLVALCQFLPGPASSQVGIAIGLLRAGVWGGVVSWLGFTLPSVILLTGFALALQGANPESAGWLRGLLIAAVAVVAHAVWGMGKNLAPDRSRATLALFSAVAVLLWPHGWMQVLVILVAGMWGWKFFKPSNTEHPVAVHIPISRKGALIAWILFAGLLLFLPLLRQMNDNVWLAMLDSFYRTGSLVFGGGHVVLPLLQSEVVPNGWMSTGEFLAGYAAAQAVPGPMFTFAAYLGAVIKGWTGALWATAAIFLPSFLLLFGMLPFWESIRRRPGIQAALAGINAAVVGILLAALYDPIWTKAIHSPLDVGFALVTFALITFWRWPAWLIVGLAAVGGMVLYE